MLNKSDDQTKSLWSSSNDFDVVSPLDFSLKHLNFSSLVNKPDETTKSRFKANANNISLGDHNDEKSVRMENFSGYETPYLGMKLNPSHKNLIRNSAHEVSDEDDDTFTGKRVVQNKNLDYKEKRVDAVNLIMNINLKSINIFDKSNTEKYPKFDDDLSEESIGNDQLQKESEPGNTRLSRNSNYYESSRDYKMRNSRGKSMFTKNYQKDNNGRGKESLDKIIWGGFHKITKDDNHDPNPQFEKEDDEAMFIEGAMANSVEYPHNRAVKHKNINRFGKSSVGIKPYYQK